MKSRGPKCVGVPVLFSQEKSFPVEDNAHIVLRTLRRWLPKLDRIRSVILYTENENEFQIFEKCLQIYFPRSDIERDAALGRMRAEYSLVKNGDALSGEKDQQSKSSQWTLIGPLEDFNWGTVSGEEI